MKYDSNKTLTENKQYLFEKSNENFQIISSKNNINKHFCSGRAQFFVPLKELWPLKEGWEMTNTELDNIIDVENPNEEKIAFTKWGKGNYSACFTVSTPCSVYWWILRYPQIRPNEGYFETLKSHCTTPYDERGIILGWWALNAYVEKLNPKYHSKTINLLDKKNIPVAKPEEHTQTIRTINIKSKTPTKDAIQIEKERIEKEKEKIKKEIETLKNDPNAYLLYPKDYAESKGMKEWKLYKEMFCCPRSGPDSVKCNQNIALAIKNNWEKNKPIPSELSFCGENDKNGKVDSESDYDDDPIEFNY